jgi:hypothetical protein
MKHTDAVLSSHVQPYLIVCFNPHFCSDPNFSSASSPSPPGGTSAGDSRFLPHSLDASDGWGRSSSWRGDLRNVHR